MVIPQTSLLEEGLKKYGEGIIIYVKGLKKTKMFEDRVANIASEKESARKGMTFIDDIPRSVILAQIIKLVLFSVRHFVIFSSPSPIP